MIEGMATQTEAYEIVGEPTAGGILIICDHASARVPQDIDLGIPPALLREHIAVDIGVADVARRMVGPGITAYLANISRLVCDFNRDPDAAGIIPETSDGHPIPGNALSPQGRAARIARFFDPYHHALEHLLAAKPPAFVLSIHSFTPRLASDPQQRRPWHVGVLYNEDDRGARLALPLLEAEGLIVGDQQPYSGQLLNATMNRHIEANRRPYLGVEIRQDQIGDANGQAQWAERLGRIAVAVSRHFA